MGLTPGEAQTLFFMLLVAMLLVLWNIMDDLKADKQKKTPPTAPKGDDWRGPKEPPTAA